MSWTRLAAGLLALFYGVALFAEVVAPYSAFESFSEQALLPPTTLHAGGIIYPTRQGVIDLNTGERPLIEDRTAPGRIAFWVRGHRYRWLGLIPGDRHLLGVVGSDTARLHLLGTDDQGRDYFSRLVYGSRISLCVGLVGISIAFPLGLLVGGIAGYWGSWLDAVLMRITEVLMSIPSLYLLVSLAAVLQVNPWTGVPFGNSERFLLIVILTGLVSWAGLAPVIRGQVLSLRQREYVQAARAAGGGHLYLIWRHILPQTLTYVIISATLAIPSFIVAESVLSLIGLGIQQPDASWGNMLSLATNAAVMVLNPWLIWPPTLLIMVTVLSFNILGDAFRDALDPRNPTSERSAQTI